MTVSYSSKIATVQYGSFARLLLLWNGSVYKVVWPGVLIFCAAYGIVAFVYQAIPSATLEYLLMKRQFVRLCVYAGRISNAIPISFVLGFYVNLVVGRWWKQFLNLPTLDALSLALTAYLREPKKSTEPKSQAFQRNRSTFFRRQIIRYMNLSSVLCFSSISVGMKRRFPNLDSLVDARLMTDKEMGIYSQYDQSKNHFFVPVVWAIHLVSKAHQEGMIVNSRQLEVIIQEISSLWDRLYTLLLYDWVNVPLVYNQVVAMAVYLYFAVCVLSQQFADPVSMLYASDSSFNYLISQHPPNNSSDLSNNLTSLFNATAVENHQNIIKNALDVLPNIPIFTILALLFYDGWVKVAEAHVFPFGDDDDDFDVVTLLNRNIKASVWMVDTALRDYLKMPEPLRTGCHPKSGDHEGDLMESRFGNTNQYSASNPNESYEDDDALSGICSDRTSSVAEIPELPCPESLRRSVSHNFFRGSLALIYDDESGQRLKSRNSIAYESGACTPISTGSSIGPGHESWLESASAALSRLLHRPSMIPSSRLSPSRRTDLNAVESDPDETTPTSECRPKEQ